MRDYEQFLSLLDGEDISPLEASRRASKFLVAMSYVDHDLIGAEYNMALSDDAHDIQKAELLITTPDSMKNIQMRNAYVIRSPQRKEKYEKYIARKAKFEHLKRLFTIFQEAHHFFRQKGNS